MTRLADQYVALRKQTTLQQNTSTSSGNADNVIAHNRTNFKNSAATQRANSPYSRNANTSPKNSSSHTRVLQQHQEQTQ